VGWLHEILVRGGLAHLRATMVCDAILLCRKPSQRFIAARQKAVADEIMSNLKLADEPSGVMHAGTPIASSVDARDSSAGEASASSHSTSSLARSKAPANGSHENLSGFSSFPDGETAIAGEDAAQKKAEASRLHAMSLSKGTMLRATSSPLGMLATSSPLCRPASDGSGAATVMLPLTLTAGQIGKASPASRQTSFEIGGDEEAVTNDTIIEEKDGEAGAEASKQIRQRKRNVQQA
jgi:hypothetical protein